MICFPNAKINIGLNIIEKRADNFHNIESVFYPVNLCDILELIEDKDTKETHTERIQFHVSGIPIPDETANNLCVRAYNLISSDYSIPPIKTHLHKIIPIGAGLGGGSADAAFFIKLINDAFHIGITEEAMKHYANKLGSDCSFFINNKSAFVQGRGDIQKSIELDLRGYFFVLVYPSIHINTAIAYSNVIPRKPEYALEELILKLPVNDWRKFIRNDFEVSVFPKFPQIEKIKEQLYLSGALYASMSGSGSTVYGIFNENSIDFKKIFSDYRVWQGKFS